VNEQRTISRLIAAGMTEDEAERKAERFAALEASLRAIAGPAAASPRAYWIPGRIEFLGKHTDYAGGRSLLCAVERGLCVLAAARRDGRVRMHDLCREETMTCRLQPDLAPTAGHWSMYPMTVARRLARNFPGALRGVDIVFASDLPPAAGLSSSSALITAVVLALADANEFTARVEYRRNIRGPEDLASYLSCVENGRSFGALTGDAGVGTLGGSEDHTAILCSRPGALVQYAFCPVHFERAIALPDDHHFVVAASGVQAEKAGAARERYNRASRAMEAILDRWRRATGREDGTVAEAIASAPDAPDRMRACLRDIEDGDAATSLLLDRFEHFLGESEEIVPAAAEAIAHGALETLGNVVDRSQERAERLLGNQIPETVALARMARELGAVAASAFGAGFGGSVWALVHSEQAGEFRARWTERYSATFPDAAARAHVFESRAGPPMMRL